MHIHFDLLLTFFAVLFSFVLFSMWFVLRTVRENRKIKLFCLSLGGSIRSLSALGDGELSDSQRNSYEQIRSAYNAYIKNSAVYKRRLVDSINDTCGTSYGLYDLHDCFENEHPNSFFRDVVGRSGFLFINIVYMSHLEKSGCCISETGFAGKYL